MKVTIEFNSDEEKSKILSLIGYTLPQPSTNLDEIEKALNDYVKATIKTAYVQGGIKKLAQENQPSLVEEANTIF